MCQVLSCSRNTASLPEAINQAKADFGSVLCFRIIEENLIITFTVPSGFVEEKTKEKVENREEIYILHYDLTVVIRNDTYLLQINTKIFSD